MAAGAAALQGGNAAGMERSHAEAQSAPNGIGLVKLMGRYSGFLAAHAALCTGDVNFCLVPEVPFLLEEGDFGFLPELKRRLQLRNGACRGNGRSELRTRCDRWTRPNCAGRP